MEVTAGVRFNIQSPCRAGAIVVTSRNVRIAAVNTTAGTATIILRCTRKSVSPTRNKANAV